MSDDPERGKIPNEQADIETKIFVFSLGALIMDTMMFKFGDELIHKSPVAFGLLGLFAVGSTGGLGYYYEKWHKFRDSFKS